MLLPKHDEWQSQSAPRLLRTDWSDRHPGSRPVTTPPTPSPLCPGLCAPKAVRGPRQCRLGSGRLPVGVFKLTCGASSLCSCKQNGTLFTNFYHITPGISTCADSAEVTLETLKLSSNRDSWRDFPGGPVVKTLRFHCRGYRSDPWSGN